MKTEKWFIFSLFHPRKGLILSVSRMNSKPPVCHRKAHGTIKADSESKLLYGILNIDSQEML